MYLIQCIETEDEISLQYKLWAWLSRVTASLYPAIQRNYICA